MDLSLLPAEGEEGGEVRCQSRIRKGHDGRAPWQRIDLSNTTRAFPLLFSSSSPERHLQLIEFGAVAVDCTLLKVMFHGADVFARSRAFHTIPPHFPRTKAVTY